MRSHDFIGPFRGAECPVSVNLAQVVSLIADKDKLFIELCVYVGPAGDRAIVYTFDTEENYRDAVSVLRCLGVPLK